MSRIDWEGIGEAAKGCGCAVALILFGLALVGIASVDIIKALR